MRYYTKTEIPAQVAEYVSAMSSTGGLVAKCRGHIGHSADSRAFCVPPPPPSYIVREIHQEMEWGGMGRVGFSGCPQASRGATERRSWSLCPGPCGRCSFIAAEQSLSWVWYSQLFSLAFPIEIYSTVSVQQCQAGLYSSLAPLMMNVLLCACGTFFTAFVAHTTLFVLQFSVQKTWELDRN